VLQAASKACTSQRHLDASMGSNLEPASSLSSCVRRVLDLESDVSRLIGQTCLGS